MAVSLVFRAGPTSIDDLRGKVKEGITKLKGLDIGNELSVGILAQLVGSRMTVAEIVERIYGIGNSEEGFQSCYGRVRRELRRLESKGLVSRKLFGNNRPYRLTQLAITNLARIGGEEQQQSVLPRTDMAAFLVTLALAMPTASHTLGLLELAESTTIGLFGCFCFFLGISVYGSVRAIRRVF